MTVREAAEGLLYGLFLLWAACSVFHLRFLGVEKGTFQITNELVADLLRASARGYNPMNTFILDAIYTFIAFVRFRLAAHDLIYLLTPEFRLHCLLRARGLMQLWQVSVSSIGSTSKARMSNCSVD
jgi:hypothetical protein